MGQRAGLKVEDIVLCQPDSGEMALEVVDQLVRSHAIDLIAVDSVAALVPRAEIEGEIGAVQGGPPMCFAAPALLAPSSMLCVRRVCCSQPARYRLGRSVHSHSAHVMSSLVEYCNVQFGEVLSMSLS